MAEQLSKQDVAEYEEAFTIIDKDGDGILTIDELREYMESIGQTPTEAELLDMLHIDKNNNGSGHGSGSSCGVNLKQFLNLMARKEGGDRFMQAFKFFDKDGDGFITPSELREAINRFGESFTQTEAEEMILESDVDADGRLCFREFVNKMKQCGIQF